MYNYKNANAFVLRNNTNDGGDCTTSVGAETRRGSVVASFVLAAVIGYNGSIQGTEGKK